MTIIQQHPPEWHEARRKTLGGSDANIIVNGTDEQRMKLWKVKCGLAEPDNLDDVFQVQLGSFTESFNMAWFCRKTGAELRSVQHRITHDNGWMSCTLDGIVEIDGADAVLEAKHTNERTSLAEATARYQPQLHHNMIVTGLRRAYLTVIMGNTWDYQEVEYDDLYAVELQRTLYDFWECVRLGMPPSDAPTLLAPPPPTRIVDMTGNNEWGNLAAEWIATREPAKRYDKAAAGLKKLIGEDVKLAKGHGIQASRNKRGAITITEGE